MKTIKMTQQEKLAFFKENGYFFGDKKKDVKKLLVPSEKKEINREDIFKVEEIKILSDAERVAIEERNIERRIMAIKNNL